MSRIFLIVLFSLFIFAPFVIKTSIADNNISTNISCNISGNKTITTQDLWCLTATNFPAVILALIGSGGIIGIIITQHLNERYKIREKYYKPYVKWSIRFSGILHEFEEVCRNIMIEERGSLPRRNSRIDIISHLCQMHDQLEEGYQHTSWIKKNNWRYIERLDNFMDIVDRLWHRLEQKYSSEFIVSTDNPNKRLKQIIMRSILTGNIIFIVEEIRMSLDQDIDIIFRDFSNERKIKEFSEKYNQPDNPAKLEEKFDTLFVYYFDPIYYLLAVKAPPVGLTNVKDKLKRFGFRIKIFFGKENIRYRDKIQN